MTRPAHVPEPGSSIELSPDIMQTQEINVQATGNECSVKSDQIKNTSSSKNIVEGTEFVLIPTNVEPIVDEKQANKNIIKSPNQQNKTISNTSVENSSKPKALNLPKGLTITMKEKTPTYEPNQTEEQTGLRSEEAATPVQVECFSNQEQLLEIISNTNTMPKPSESEEPETIEEILQTNSDETANQDIQKDEIVIEEDRVEPEFDYFGCEVCKADSKPVDKFNVILTHKCPICPCVCFCAHLLKEHMKVIHGWFNVQRRWY